LCFLDSIARTKSATWRRPSRPKLADSFEGAVGEIIETVSSASTELQASAGSLTKTAARAQQITTTVAAASEQASTNMQSVASATEELSSSVNEISRQVQDSARIANDCRSSSQDQRTSWRIVESRNPHRRCSGIDQHHRGPNPICWRSMRPSKRHGPAKQVAVSRLWLRK
jgi:hypothetical protein